MSAQHTPVPRRQVGRFSFPADKLPAALIAREAVEKAQGGKFTALERELLEVARLLVEANCPEAVAFATQRAHAAIAKATGSAP